MRRRDFLLGTAGSLAALSPLATLSACAGAVRPARAGSRWDIVLRGGTLFDGTGAGGIEGDLAISAGRIAWMGRRADGTAALELDARGLAVAPGFVDIHSHGDRTLFADPAAESLVRQGITLIVVGQDGDSAAPASPGPARLAEALAALAALPPAVNVASMVGLGSVRAAVVGEADRRATPDEMSRMAAIVEQALADGACGASSGLEYAPGAFADRAELAALCRPLAARGLAYATHMRNEDDTLLEAIGEAIAIARAAGCALQISHLKTQGTRNWPKIGAALAAIESARRDGLDVAFDRYPYVAYSTGLSNLWPPASLDGGTAAFMRRLRDPATAPAMRAYALDKVAALGGWDHVQITSVAGSAPRAAEGKRMDEWAAAAGADPYDAAVALMEGASGDIGMVGFGMSEENLARFLAHPLGMVCSDGGAFATSGPARRGHPHPRGLGSFPRVLGRYVREQRVLTLPQAIHKMTALPASRIGVRDRGVLRPGAAADVVVFDPATVADRATFAEPFQYPVGIRDVIVNGVPALLDGERTTRRAGSTVTPSRAS